jgi:hypothetical protein
MADYGYPGGQVISQADTAQTMTPRFYRDGENIPHEHVGVVDMQQ